MLFAAVRNAPVIGGRVEGFDAARATTMPGVTAAIEVPGGVAVIAATWWQAKSALDQVQVGLSSTGSGGVGRRCHHRWLARDGGVGKRHVGPQAR